MGDKNTEIIGVLFYNFWIAWHPPQFLVSAENHKKINAKNPEIFAEVAENKKRKSSVKLCVVFLFVLCVKKEVIE